MLLSERHSAFHICWFEVEAKLCSSTSLETELHGATNFKDSRREASQERVFVIVISILDLRASIQVKFSCRHSNMFHLIDP